MIEYKKKISDTFGKRRKIKNRATAVKIYLDLGEVVSLLFRINDQKHQRY